MLFPIGFAGNGSGEVVVEVSAFVLERASAAEYGATFCRFSRML